jgi:GGDEF domain-containing protein
VSRVVGLSMQELRSLSEDDFISRVFNRPEQVRQMIDEAAARGETVSADLELVQLGDERRWVHCLISVQHMDGQTVEGVIYDITERKSDENAVRHRAEHDALTQLKNRAAGQATLERFVAETLARNAPLCVACVDLDGFKQINDSHGHACGDEVLVACAERMRTAVRRSSDLIARLGGDEFLVALRDVGPGDPVLSIGVACLPLHGSEPPRLVRIADEALYHVKRNGKQAFALALPGLNPSQLTLGLHERPDA